MSGKNWISRRYMKEFVSQRWSKSRIDRLTRKVDAGLPTDSFIGRGRTIRYDTIEEINVDSKAEYTA